MHGVDVLAADPPALGDVVGDRAVKSPDAIAGGVGRVVERARVEVVAVHRRALAVKLLGHDDLGTAEGCLWIGHHPIVIRRARRPRHVKSSGILHARREEVQDRREDLLHALVVEQLAAEALAARQDRVSPLVDDVAGAELVGQVHAGDAAALPQAEAPLSRKYPPSGQSLRSTMWCASTASSPHHTQR